MNIINAVTIGKLIAAHRESDEEKFRAYVEFIAEAYEQQGNDRAANIIRSNYTGDYGEQRKAVRPEARGDRCGVYTRYRQMDEKINHRLIDQNNKSGIM